MNLIAGFLFGFGVVSLVTGLLDSRSSRKGHKEKIPLTKKELNGILIYSGITLIGAIGIVLTNT